MMTNINFSDLKISAEYHKYLQKKVHEADCIIISGNTKSGNIKLLKELANEIPSEKIIISIED